MVGGVKPKNHMIKFVPMRLSAIVLTCLPLILGAADSSETVATVTTARELTSIQESGRGDISFDITGTIILHGTPGTRHFSVCDETGSAYLTLHLDYPRECLRLGDVVRAVGVTTNDIRGFAYALCNRIDHIGNRPPPEPRSVTPQEMLAKFRQGDHVRLIATVNDIFFDEITPRWIYLDLAADDHHVIAALIPGNGPTPVLERLIGVRVALTGICTRPIHNDRAHTGPMVYAHGSESLVPLQNPLPDPFSVPALPPTDRLRPDEFKNLGRVRETGIVLAVWGKTHLLLRTPSGDIRRIDLLQPSTPACGDCIDVVGSPETDLYHVNFARALWRPSDTAIRGQSTPTPLSLNVIFKDELGEPCIRTQYHGQPITVIGIVRSLPSAGNDSGRLYLESDKFILPVDISACPDTIGNIAVGCTVRASGTCVVDLPNWQPTCVVPRIQGVFLVPRTPRDLEILSRPPWWTPARMLVTLGALLLVLFCIILWNILLRRLAERRGRELARESIAHAESDFKTLERTRLAVELHDSVSQSLTGVAMEIEAALQFKEHAQNELLKHLDIAWRTLRACRAELRNCLWDLRNHALEESDMAMAIRRTLLPHLESVNLTVRFSVPREKFTDNTTHAILRMIRELAVNAIRHGHATELKVAGSIEGDILRFSVRDNGCGFDPKTAPGIPQGHFGLQGIRERAHLLHGEVNIDSIPNGKGTRVSVSFRIPHNHCEGKSHEEDFRCSR